MCSVQIFSWELCVRVLYSLLFFLVLMWKKRKKLSYVSAVNLWTHPIYKQSAVLLWAKPLLILIWHSFPFSTSVTINKTTWKLCFYILCCSLSAHTGEVVCVSVFAVDCSLERSTEYTQAGGFSIGQFGTAFISTKWPLLRGHQPCLGPLFQGLAWENAGFPLWHISG